MRRGTLEALIVILSVAASPAVASAQPAGPVQRLQQYGGTNAATARRIARHVHERMTRNAARGGDRYDPLRQALGAALFGGPGRNRAEYDARLREVLARLGRGLTDENLTALFGGQDALACTRLFGLSMQDCDSLGAAAAREDVGVPYIAPDDGAALRNELVTAGLSAAHADEAVSGLGRTLLSVPGSADRSARGRLLTRLLNECPGGLPDLESRIRAWHMGPTPGMARCLVRALGRQGRHAPQLLVRAFGIRAAAVPLLQWAHGQTVRAPQVARAEPPQAAPQPRARSAPRPPRT
ncbi:MAG TPA: hypothetical protein RMH99_10330, partial [Sandaracinaceae bacterium LLY-WYZ-13_1]|nr:hypothetical protein [Sandaracinaceae bacterium LLY-WYZ-13_1]